MKYELITQPTALASFLEKLAGDEVIALDTEFMRERTFFAQLCLIQIAGRSGAGVIDVLAPGFTGNGGGLDTLWHFLSEEKRVKVVHAGSQDIEIFYHLTKKIFPNIIDTQLAGAVLGIGDNLGYQKLVEIFLKKNLDKTMQFINWHMRPLPQRALDYAAIDVIYLLDIYEKIENQLTAKNRMPWLTEEMQKLLDVKTYELDPSRAWQRLKKLPRGSKKLRALQLLAAWREEQAIKRNLPRGFVLRDEWLLDICNHLPTSADDMRNMRGLRDLLNQKQNLESIFALIRRAIAEGDSAPPSNGEKEKGDFVMVPENALEMLKLLLKIVAREEGVVPRIIARESDLVDFLLQKPGARILQHWRYDIFGKKAEQLLRGQLAFKLKNDEIEFIEQP